MSIRQKHKELMVQWSKDREHGNGRFIADGPLNWETWGSRQDGMPRVLFLLKEAYDKDQNTDWALDSEYRGTPLETRWSLPSLLREWMPEGHSLPGTTYRRVALWARSMREFQSGMLPTDEYCCDGAGNANGHLIASAVVNIKKYDGDNRSEVKDLTRHLSSKPWKKGGPTNIELLQEQLTLLNPDIVICGNTYAALKAAVPPESTWLTKGDSVWDVHRHGDSIWFDYWHPSAFSIPTFLLVQGLHAMRVQFESKFGSIIF